MKPVYAVKNYDSDEIDCLVCEHTGAYGVADEDQYVEKHILYETADERSELV